MKDFLLLSTQIVLLVFSEYVTHPTCGDRCCLNFYKDIYNGSCVECPLGTHGVNCSGNCVPRYYGRFCLSKCDCPVHLCDIMYGCMSIKNTNGRDNHWKFVAFTLMGSITTLVVVGLMMLMKSCFAKRCKQEIIVSDESQTGLNSLNPNGNHKEENKFEGQRSTSSPEEIEAVHLHNMSAENNYADLRTSALSPIYDNPDDFETDLMQRTLMLVGPWQNRSNK